MSILLKWRLAAHEWLADHVGWVQYPNIRLVSKPIKPKARPPLFKHAMPAGTRVALTLLSLMLLAILIPAMAAALFFLYAFLGAVFGWIPKP